MTQHVMLFSSSTATTGESSSDDNPDGNETTALLSSNQNTTTTFSEQQHLSSFVSQNYTASTNERSYRGLYGSTNNYSNNNSHANSGEGVEVVIENVLSSDGAGGDEPGITVDADPNNNSESPNEGDDDEELTDGNEDATRDGAIGTLTRRLRCLFSTITWPIVPLGTIVALALLWVLYAASSLDLRKSCSHPLHWYSLASLILVAYIPHHAQVRSHLFHYSRERDGPIRPARVRMYDQFFHTVCLLYVYTGVTLIQTCREDLISGQDAIDIAGNEIAMPNDGPLNSCQATCPNLYQALSVYIATLEMFTFALILPLLFLPCIYLWFLRRATAEAEAFAQLQDRLQEEEALLNNGGVTAGEIIDSLENVKLVSRRKARRDISGDSDQEIWLLPSSATDASIGTSIGMKSEVKECCICMSDFPIQTEEDLEDGLFEDGSNHNNSVRRKNDSQVTPAVRNDDDPKNSDNEGSLSTLKECGIVRTKCGHIFHKECLSGWVSGRWQLNPNNTNSTNNEDTANHDRRRRRARQTCCPLCREDLRPTST